MVNPIKRYGKLEKDYRNKEANQLVSSEFFIYVFINLILCKCARPTMINICHINFPGDFCFVMKTPTT